jgi:phage protein D
MIGVAEALLGRQGAPASVRRPVLELRFGSATAGDWGRHLAWLVVERSLAPSVDAVELCLAAREGGATAAPELALGDAGSVSMGYEDAGVRPVFAGAVQAIKRSIDGTRRVTATGGAAILARLRVSQSYERQSAGDVVRDLARRAGVSAGTIDDGIDLPFFVADDRQSAYAHIAMLARRSGVVAYFTPEDELTFAGPSGESPAPAFRYGQDVLALAVDLATQLAGATIVTGEGAASSHGLDAWHWPAKDASAVTKTAGEGQPERRAYDAGLRTVDAAEAAAIAAAEARALAARAGVLAVPGAPDVEPGGVIEIAGTGTLALDGQCQVRHVRHVYTKRLGFTTTIQFSRLASGAGPAPGAVA